MEIEKTSGFARNLKKLHSNQIKFLNAAIREISANPNIGITKVGDLDSFKVFKFQSLDQVWLLAYTFDGESTVTLHAVGPHENFYTQLKRKL